MFNLIKSIFFFLTIVLFIFFVFFYYFSEINISKINDNRLNQTDNIQKNIADLPLLKNDTSNIILYTDSNLEKKNFKKRYFWELLNRKKDE